MIVLEKTFFTPISTIATHPTDHRIIAIGFFDGVIHCCLIGSLGSPIKDKVKLERVWMNKLKRAVRALDFSQDGEFLYAICANRALCAYEVKNGRRVRCIQRSHIVARPNSLTVLPSYSHHAEFATGAEDGEVRLWDFRLSEPMVMTVKEQQDVINSFDVYKNYLLAASSDHTLCSYDFRHRKTGVRSEEMHGDLLSIAVTEKFTYAGASDGFIEVFKNGEYGNIWGRIETTFSLGVECLVEMRSNLLLASSVMSDEMRFYHVEPNKQLQKINHFGGTDILLKTRDHKYLLCVGSFSSKFQIYQLTNLIEGVPVLQAQDVSARGVTKDLREGTFIGVADSDGFSKRAKQRVLQKRKRPVADDFFRDLIDDDDDGPNENDGDGSGEDADSDDNFNNVIEMDDEDGDEEK